MTKHFYKLRLWFRHLLLGHKIFLGWILVSTPHTVAHRKNFFFYVKTFSSFAIPVIIISLIIFRPSCEICNYVLVNNLAAYNSKVFRDQNIVTERYSTMSPSNCNIIIFLIRPTFHSSILHDLSLCLISVCRSV